jgi:predicted DNA-binding protein (MmcQ/YjbR family)
MTRDEVIDLCAGMPGAVEDYPFGESVVVFKVGGRIFALVGLDGDPGSVNLKCDPALALELRDRHPSVRPGYHMNKRHWNSVDFGSAIDPAEFTGMIEHSYELVVRALPAAKRAEISKRAGQRARS